MGGFATQGGRMTETISVASLFREVSVGATGTYCLVSSVYHARRINSGSRVLGPSWKGEVNL